MILAAAIRWRGFQRLVALVPLVGLTIFLYYYLGRQSNAQPRAGVEHDRLDEHHPIDDLIDRANDNFAKLLDKETSNVLAAAEAYRKRRNRHPPPGFDAWFHYAKKQKAVLIEDLFDQVYDDLEPFWALSPKHIRDSVGGHEYVISVRNGALDKRRDKRYRINFWHEMFQKIARFLPDVDVPFNIMDESRLLVPWETVNDYVREASSKGKLVQDNVPLPTVQRSAKYDTFKSTEGHDYHWIGQGSMWDLAKEACPPDSPARRATAVTDLSVPPKFPAAWPYGSYEGYVANWTVAKDPCHQPGLRDTHGTFIEPVSLSVSKDLFPIFGGSKLPMNNEILVPAPRYWTTESRFSGSNFWSLFGTVHDWNAKKDAVIWRGAASGGRNRMESWTHFQRHRFVSMVNATHVERASMGHFPPQHFPLPDSRRPYRIGAVEADSLPTWIASFADAAFTDLQCFPRDSDTHCRYTDEYYSVIKEMDMYEMFAYKYLPDIDGNSFSGRYRAFLQSSSLPIKATIYSEWHDSRLFAWKHFVPMDNTFRDFYGIMDYFLGYNDQRGHDSAARKIAEEGKAWAEKVLRKEDMLVYVYRLMLEYARVSSDDREFMGYHE